MTKICFLNLTTYHNIQRRPRYASGSSTQYADGEWSSFANLLHTYIVKAAFLSGWVWNNNSIATSSSSLSSARQHPSRHRIVGKQCVRDVFASAHQSPHPPAPPRHPPSHLYVCTNIVLLRVYKLILPAAAHRAECTKFRRAYIRPITQCCHHPNRPVEHIYITRSYFTKSYLILPS